MYQSIPSLNPPGQPPGKLLKTAKSQPPRFLSDPRGVGLSWTLFFLLILHFFTIFKISIINLPTEHLQIHKNNIDFINEKYVKIVLICISYQLIFRSNALPQSNPFPPGKNFGQMPQGCSEGGGIVTLGID